jgi:hypothetical protein
VKIIPEQKTTRTMRRMRRKSSAEAEAQEAVKILDVFACSSVC